MAHRGASRRRGSGASSPTGRGAAHATPTPATATTTERTRATALRGPRVLASAGNRPLGRGACGAGRRLMVVTSGVRSSAMSALRRRRCRPRWSPIGPGSSVRHWSRWHGTWVGPGERRGGSDRPRGGRLGRRAGRASSASCAERQAGRATPPAEAIRPIGLVRGSSLLAEMQPDARPDAPSRGTLRRSIAPSLDLAPWIGPVLMLAAIAFIVVARQFVTVSSPGLILLVFVAISGVLAGIVPALVSAGLFVAFVAADASSPGQLFVYDSAALSRLFVNITTAVVMALLVGGIQQRLAGPTRTGRQPAQRGSPAGPDGPCQRGDPDHRRRQRHPRGQPGDSRAVRLPDGPDRRSAHHQADAPADAQPAPRGLRPVPGHRSADDPLAGRRAARGGLERARVSDRGLDRRVRRRLGAALHRDHSRHQPAQGHRGPASAGAEDGRDRPPGGRRRARLQQPADRDRRLRRAGRGAPSRPATFDSRTSPASARRPTTRRR